MQLAYLDESYNSAYYWMTAVVLDCERATDLEASLNQAIETSCSKHLGWVPNGIEYHGYELFHGENEWAVLNGRPRARISIYADALRALAAGGVKTILRGVDRRAHAARYPDPWGAHQVVLWHLMERIDEITSATGPPVLVIADEIASPELYRGLVAKWRKYGTPGYRSTKLPCVIDTIHFVPSSSSRFVQAADLVSFLHLRRASGVDTHPKALAGNAMLWSIIEPNVVHRNLWAP